MQYKSVIGNLLFLSLILLSFVNIVKSDIPVHCLISDIEGEWVIRISNHKFDGKVNEFKSSCGHGLPDKIDDTVGDIDFDFPNHSDKLLTLDSNYKVYENGSSVGSWTPVYDQSFFIYYGNSILTAPYKYYKNNEGSYESNCKKTMIGWYVPDVSENTKNWSCFYAFKKGTILSSHASHSFLQKKMNLSSNSSNLISLAQIETAEKIHKYLKYENLHSMVKEINDANLTWKAEVHDEYRGLSLVELREKLGLRSQYKFFQNKKSSKRDDKVDVNFLQKKKNYSDLGLDKELTEFLNSLDEQTESVDKKISNFEKNSKIHHHETLSTATTSGHSNHYLKNSKIPQVENNHNNDGRDKDSIYVHDYSETSKYINTPLDQIDENKLPRNWDWRNLGGKNYIPSIKVQGHCGSCYVFSTITILEARLRIKTDNQDTTSFSKQFPLSCNFYSEGCDGGFPFLVSKFLNEFEIVPEDCFAYTQSTGVCSNVCDYKNKYTKKYRVSEYGYLGGYYGAANEVLMLKELRARGPIPGNIRVPVSFQYYKKGIYSDSSLTKNADRLSKTTMVDRNLSWEKVDHSITLVGYGEENGVKYWIGMNTWGTGWGEDGYFKILRGENECSIESMGEYFNIEFTTR